MVPRSIKVEMIALAYIGFLSVDTKTMPSHMGVNDHGSPLKLPVKNKSSLNFPSSLTTLSWSPLFCLSRCLLLALQFYLIFRGALPWRGERQPPIAHTKVDIVDLTY